MDKDGIEIALEDLDHMVGLVRQHRSISFFLGVVHSANAMRGALEMQLPAKVKELNDDYGYFVCNNCDKVIAYENDYREHKYCLNCGQKLDW